MSRRLAYILIIFFHLDIFTPVYSQIQVQRTLGVEDGLAQSMVNWIHVDRNGYIWFATVGGVSRWDGINFVNFMQENGLSNNFVHTMFESRNGDFYFGTNVGVSILRDNKFKTLTKTSGLADNKIYAIHESKDGTFYFGTRRGGVSIYKNGRFKTLNKAKGLTDNLIVAISEGKDGTLFFGTYSGGVNLYKNGTLKSLTEENGLVSNLVRSLYIDEDGKVYIFTVNGINIYENGKCEVLKSHQDLNLTWGGQVVYSGTDRSFYLLSTLEVFIYKNGNLKKLDIQNDFKKMFTSIYVTPRGTLYLGTEGAGVKIYKPGKFMTLNKESGLLHNTITGITEDFDGKLYFGTLGGGVGVLENGQLDILTTEDGLVSNHVRSVYRSDDGTLYFGMRGSGVSIYKDGMFKTLRFDGNWQYNYIISIHEGYDGTMYFGTYYKGVWRYKNGQVDSFNRETGLADRAVTVIHESQDSTLFLGTLNGLICYKDGKVNTLTKKDGLSDNNINCIYEGKNGTIYIGTNMGFNLYRNGQFTTIDVSDGLSNNHIYSIIEDDEGKIYFTTNRGVNILDFSQEGVKVRTLRKTDGLASDEGEILASYKDSRGYLWFGTIEGASRYNPEFDKPNTNPPKVHITRTRLFGEEIPLPFADNFNFQHDENYFQFEYIGINLDAAEEVIYRYRLSGMDKDWIETKNRYVQYTKLDDGDYTFEVKAMNEWGYWSEPVKLHFTILPPFWERWWFRVFGLFIIAGILWQLHHSRLAKILAVERVRVRIASDLHDDIGAMLTQLAVYSEVLQSKVSDENKIRATAQKVGRLTREVLKMFSDIVWSIDARNDNIGNLVTRMQDTARQILNPKDIQMSFRIADLELDKTLASSLRQNIYLIFKEAVHNVAKHSNASKVEIIFEKMNHGFQLIIRDNGKFLQEGENSSGAGLNNMQLRARRIGGNLKIKNNGGLTVTLTTNAS